MSAIDSSPAAIVFGCAGLTLTEQERSLFRRVNPFGFILFRRNCDSVDQVRALVDALHQSVGRAVPILIDQEGGRVARLRPPHWPELAAARAIGAIAPQNLEQAKRAAWCHGRLLASMLLPLGITIDCAPVADVPVPGAHDVIGDRAFALDPMIVSDLAMAQAQGLMAGGVLPVVKHLPGHGRAFADSHKELPRVDASRSELDRHDFVPFRHLAELPLGMVAHVVFAALDPEFPASLSRTVIDGVIRQDIGFDGLLFSDDVGMQALSGSPAQRVEALLAGGCDIALHCSGDYAEMAEIAIQAQPMGERSLQRWQRAATPLQEPVAIDEVTLRQELMGLLMRGIGDA